MTNKSKYRLSRPLVLVGMMGAGKSSIGKRLASALGLSFCDVDAEIEAMSQMRIEDIFAQYGEGDFRTRERDVIERLLRSGEAQIIAIGGGAFCDKKTHKLISTHASTLWLKVAFNELHRRLEKGRRKRPLLAQKDEGDRKDILRDLLKRREPFYAQADMMVESNNDTHSEAVKAIIAQLQERGMVADKGT